MEKEFNLTKLIEQIIAEEDTHFHYEVCPYFRNCSRKVERICLKDYWDCNHYKHRLKIAARMKQYDNGGLNI